MPVSHYRLIFAATVLFLTGLSVLSQNDVQPVYSVKADANACELNSLYLDMMAVDAANSGRPILAIFRRGNRETESVNEKRLQHVKKLLSSRKTLNVVYARGDKTGGQPRIDFYLSGALFLTSSTKINMTPCMDCCDDGPETPQFLGPKGSKKSKSKRR